MVKSSCGYYLPPGGQILLLSVVAVPTNAHETRILDFSRDRPGATVDRVLVGGSDGGCGRGRALSVTGSG
jgi:hypothetical protein